MMDRYVVGGFYRVHAERGVDENLNAPGASFVPLAFAESTTASAGRQARRQRAQPLLHVRRDRPPGHAGGQLRAGSHRPRRRNLRLSCCAWDACGAGVSRRTIASQSYGTPPAHQAGNKGRGCVSTSKSSLAGADAGRHRCRLRRHRHQPAVCAEGGLRLRARAIHARQRLGILSIFFWTLTVIVSLKYVVLVLRADNNGEGGLIAMLALASQAVKDKPRCARAAGWASSARHLFYGDGVITPAISVLSAVEGLEVVSPAFKRYVMPLTLVVLTRLFAVQKRFGTGGIGRSSGRSRWCGSWCWRCWACRTSGNTRVLVALSPHHALGFMLAQPRHRLHGAGRRGAVRHRGRGAVRRPGPLRQAAHPPGLVSVVMPALTLNYFGQGALLLENPDASRTRST
jgi:hypothetical protein